MAGSEPIIFYDANCTLCRMWMEGVAASGWRALRFVDANDTELARKLGIGDTRQLQERMCLLRPDGTAAWGYDAVVALLRLGDGACGIAALMASRPVARVGRWIYEKIARSRSCAAPHRALTNGKLATSC